MSIDIKSVFSFHWSSNNFFCKNIPYLRKLILDIKLQGIKIKYYLCLLMLLKKIVNHPTWKMCINLYNNIKKSNPTLQFAYQILGMLMQQQPSRRHRQMIKHVISSAAGPVTKSNQSFPKTSARSRCLGLWNMVKDENSFVIDVSRMRYGQCRSKNMKLRMLMPTEEGKLPMPNRKLVPWLFSSFLCHFPRKRSSCSCWETNLIRVKFELILIGIGVKYFIT